MGPFFDVEQSVRKRKRFFFLHENEREKNIAEAQRKVFRVSVSDGFFLTFEIFWFADDCSSYIINVLTAEKFWNHFVCKVDDVNEVSDAGIDDSSVERWLFLY